MITKTEEAKKIISDQRGTFTIHLAFNQSGSQRIRCNKTEKK